mmetsp:Transcript_3857/g.11827  ORF Transcript_3857/g.11827 Transcript_3857/m.11827 type:complete len:465 (-) Transcript_3857:137-1531(-)
MPACAPWRGVCALGSVVGVLLDVLVREVGPKHGGADLRVAAEVDLDLDAARMDGEAVAAAVAREADGLVGQLRLLEVRAQSLFLGRVEVELAILKDNLAGDLDDALLWHRVAARAEDLAELADEAADVWVVAGDGALQKRPVQNRAPKLARGALVARVAAHGDADDVVRALAVAHDVVRELRADGAEALLERRRRRRGTGARAQTHDHVARRLVAVDAHGVVRPLHDALQARLQLRAADLCVGEDEGEHGGEVGLDHARALCDADDGVARGERVPRDFGVAVRRHHGLGHAEDGVRRRDVHRRHGIAHGRRGQTPSDDARRRREHGVCAARNAEPFGDGGADRLGRILAAALGPHVGDLVVDDDTPDGAAAGHAPPADGHRRAAEGVARVYSGHVGARFVQHDGGDVHLRHGALQLRGLERELGHGRLEALWQRGNGLHLRQPLFRARGGQRDVDELHRSVRRL